MTDLQRQLAIAVHGATMMPGTWSKRFARDLCGQARSEQEGGEDRELTPKQHAALCRLVVTFRRQINHRLVDAARAELDAMPAAESSQ